MACRLKLTPELLDMGLWQHLAVGALAAVSLPMSLLEEVAAVTQFICLPASSLSWVTWDCNQKILPVADIKQWCSQLWPCGTEEYHRAGAQGGSGFIPPLPWLSRCPHSARIVLWGRSMMPLRWNRALVGSAPCPTQPEWGTGACAVRWHQVPCCPAQEIYRGVPSFRG